jgi:hypothetical protein
MYKLSKLLGFIVTIQSQTETHKYIVKNFALIQQLLQSSSDSPNIFL